MDSEANRLELERSKSDLEGRGARSMLKVALSCTRCKQLGGQIISACMPGLPGC